MTWTKNLGRVKGEDGDVYMPTVAIEDGQFVFKWELKTAEEALDQLQTQKELTIPLYVPEQSSQDLEEGNTTFRLTIPVKDSDGRYLSETKTVHTRGLQGEKGDTEFKVYNIAERCQINNETDIPSNIPSADRNIYTIYIYNTDAWIWTGASFFMLEGIKLDDYYTKPFLYTKDDIDSMFTDVANEVEKILLLYDISNSVGSF